MRFMVRSRESGDVVAHGGHIVHAATARAAAALAAALFPNAETIEVAEDRRLLDQQELPLGEMQ